MQKGFEGVNGCLSLNMPLFSVCGAASRACWSYMLVLRMYQQLHSGSFVRILILLLYRDGLAQKRLIHYCAAYVAVGFVAVELCLFLSCIPLQNYWAVPTPNRMLSSISLSEMQD
jgi:hypothetical protein